MKKERIWVGAIQVMAYLVMAAYFVPRSVIMVTGAAVGGILIGRGLRQPGELIK